jgi:hypothetical protein
MQSAETVLDVLRERGRRGLPLDELYRQMFNPQLYLVAYGRLYSNKGAMTPGPDAETADGMTLAKIGSIIDALRHERYRFKPVKRRRATEPVELGHGYLNAQDPGRQVSLVGVEDGPQVQSDRRDSLRAAQMLSGQRGARRG